MGSLLISILHHGGNNAHNPLTMSDEVILGQIYTTHVHSDTKFDVGSLFTLVENILKRSTHIVDDVLQGSPGSLEHIDDKTPQASFSSPLCTLKQISSEMSCKPPGEETTHKTTLAILNKLSSYSWDAKAVLTLAAFALEYGEFWLLSQLQPTDPLAKSVAILKRVPVLTQPWVVKKHRQDIFEINNLIKITLQVIEAVFELEKLTSYYGTQDVPALASALEEIPVVVYWAIITIAAIVTQIDCLTTDSEQRQELSQFGQKINIILNKLRMHMSLCRQQIEEAEYYKILWKMIQTPTEIMEFLKVLIFWKDTPQAPIYDGAIKKPVNIEVLKKKDVFLFISTLDITEEEISIFRLIYDKTKAGDQYKIVWLPIVEEWNDELKKKFDILKFKMPWYVLQYFAPIKGLKFVMKEWQFKKKPMFVVMNPQGNILHHNAFHAVRVWGLKAFPFDKATIVKLIKEASWIEPLVNNIVHPHLTTWIKEEKYIFFYGGKDKEWIQRFTKHMETLKNDATLKETNTSIELFCVENEHPSFISFWKGVESLFVTKMHISNNVTQEVKKLLSYKNETRWGLLCKGSIAVLVAHGTTILEIVVHFDKWKKQVIEKGFDICFREQHGNVRPPPHHCSHLEIHNIVPGEAPASIKCPECHRTMELFIGYKCCRE